MMLGQGISEAMKQFQIISREELNQCFCPCLHWFILNRRLIDSLFYYSWCNNNCFSIEPPYRELFYSFSIYSVSTR